ncbi:helix-turn-helix domain-containing protein [Kitasatospora sp. CM 4170]|uniref:TetR/AcrR family transcriptional regulator n=1 Tax=Kitasatospora aburaviensis TaxID=67265 RepID=A0ABW1F895_9ACTN|nr:helix-turn-helix domain-containing protein [Kitasatospora sp. CM 4170]WNM43201.1 helix-turn-helix domain-containing protein [Kitasatospora sp. CM 4170]
MHPTTTPNQPTPLGRRERNKLKVKERLYDAAITLFAEQGYDETSIDEIAERADVARGTFFNYFQRKEDLLGAWGEKRRDTLLTTLTTHTPGTTPNTPGTPDTAVNQLRHCMTALGQINETHQQETNSLLMAWVRAGRPLLEDPYLAELFAHIAHHGITHHEFKPHFTPHQIGHALRDLYLGSLYRWCGQPHTTPGQLTNELHTTLNLILQGILTTPTP